MSRREERRGEKRAAILGIASDIFLENGYAGTTMSGIASRLGGSKGTLWSYFGCKEELFAACIEEKTQAFRTELLSVLNPAAPLRPAIDGFCRKFIGKIVSCEAVNLYRLLCGESGRSPEAGRIFYERGPGVIEAMLISFLSSHIAAGRLQNGTPQEMAHFLCAMCTGVTQTRVLLGITPPGQPPQVPQPTAITQAFFTLYGTPEPVLHPVLERALV